MVAGHRQRLVIGMSGSSAPQLGVSFIRACHELDSLETHLVMSDGARRTIELECGIDSADIEKLAHVSYDVHDMAASLSSGSFLTMGMVVVPCSMRSLGAIASGNSDNLLARAADVTLKERRRLVLVVRETPFNYIHIKNMETVTLAGATVLPPVPAFYHRPQSIDDLLRHTAGKILDQFGVQHKLFRRWQQ